MATPLRSVDVTAEFVAAYRSEAEKQKLDQVYGPSRDLFAQFGETLYEGDLAAVARDFASQYGSTFKRMMIHDVMIRGRLVQIHYACEQESPFE